MPGVVKPIDLGLALYPASVDARLPPYPDYIKFFCFHVVRR